MVRVQTHIPPRHKEAALFTLAWSPPSSPHKRVTTMVPLHDSLTPEHLDVFQEAMNIGIGRAADALAQLLDAHVRIGVSQVRILDMESFTQYVLAELGAGLTAIVQPFHNRIVGHASLLLPRGHAAQLIRVLLQRPHDATIAFSAEEESVLAEVGNIILNATLSILADMAQTRYRVSPPQTYINFSAAQLTRLITLSLPQDSEAVVLLGRLQINEVALQFYIVLLLALPAEDMQRMLRILADWAS